ncbi:MAG: outer membrane beta-barrel protein [Bacteroidota bacterium]
MRFEYKIDSNNSLIISPSLNFQKNRSVSNSISQILFDQDSVSTSDVTNQSDRNGYNLRNNILYRHSFAKKGRSLSVNLSTALNKNDGESCNYRFFDEFGIPTDSAQNQYSTNPTNGYTLSSNIAYTEPIGKRGQLQINYSPSYSKNKADQQTYLFDAFGGKYSQFDSTLSNKFDNTTTTHNGGITYRLGASRDNQFSIGVNLQHSELESQRIFPTATQVDQTFTNVLPNLMWRKKISARSSFNIFYRANTNFPSVTQLQDVVNNSNPLRISIGNPDLKQSYTHFFSGRYTFTNTQKGQSFFANIFLQAAQDYISNGTFVARDADSLIEQNVVLKRGSQLTKPVNLDGYKSFRSFLTYSMPVKFIKSNINLSTGFSYSRLPGLSNYVTTITNNYIYNAGIVIASNISEYIDFNLSYNANFNDAKSSVQAVQDNKYVNQSAGFQLNLLSKSGWFVQNDITNQTYSGLSDGLNQTYWLWNAGIGKKFLKNKSGELKLSVFDLLKQNQSIIRTVSENYIEDSQSKVLQQYFMLTFSYSLKNFGKAATSQRKDNRDRMPGF